MRKIENIIYNSHNMMLDLFLPQGESKATFIYFHGGGIESGSRKDIGEFPKYLTKHGIAVVSVEYRMYPKAQYPEFIEDGADAVLWVKENLAQYGFSDNFFIGGSSAGAYISMMLCFCNSFFEKRGLKQSEIQGYFHDAGQPTVHFNVLKQRGIDTRRIVVDEMAPLYYVGEAEEYPPMMFIVSDDDMQNRFEQTMLMISTLKHFGYEQNKILYRIMNGKHCSYIHTFDQNGDSILGKLIKEFIGKFG
ncbi:MAG: alpha/beta hydrolase [Ruminococcaceae bacterium]|nr:alpha/beta hydrolase [Oscillospiraceae bacterium]